MKLEAEYLMCVQPPIGVLRRSEKQIREHRVARVEQPVRRQQQLAGRTRTGSDNLLRGVGIHVDLTRVEQVSSGLRFVLRFGKSLQARMVRSGISQREKQRFRRHVLRQRSRVLENGQAWHVADGVALHEILAGEERRPLAAFAVEQRTEREVVQRARGNNDQMVDSAKLVPDWRNQQLVEVTRHRERLLVRRIRQSGRARLNCNAVVEDELKQLGARDLYGDRITCHAISDQPEIRRAFGNQVLDSRRVFR